MSTATLHLSQSQLADYSAGLVGFHDLDTIEEHLSHCETCREKLEDVPPSPLESFLKSSGGVSHTLLQRHPFPTIPGYEVLDVVGEGGMGVVFKARQLATGQNVAIKMMHEGVADDPSMRKRFDKADVHASARLRHPNIVTVHDAGETAAGRPFVVMRWIEGRNLKEVVEEDGRLGVREACDLITQACSALQYLHEEGLVHRDIKPSNIMVTNAGEAILLDLGLVREVSTGTNSDLTQQGAIVGTPMYMAPEQARNSHGANGLADIYSLGLVFYYSLTGRDPFPDRSPYEVLVAQQAETPTPVSTFRDDVPAAVLSVLERMTRKEPRDRFAAPIEAAKALAAARPRPTPESPGPGPRDRSRLKQWSAIAAVAASLLVAVLFLLPQRVPANVRLARAAWAAYDEAEEWRRKGRTADAKEGYAHALNLAAECVQEFHGRAKESQQALAAENLPLPPDGKITDPADRQRLLDRGLLNDVGTCLWVRARCLARLGRLDEARKVYEDASKLSFAMCWDRAQDLFWSPARKAQDDLEILDQLPLK
jgi:hypothetical protein